MKKFLSSCVKLNRREAVKTYNEKDKDMRHEDILKEKCGTDPGFRVPDGYFEELNARIMDSLPAYPETPRAVPLSFWQKVKPYVYLAAMFAGIWVMMKVFYNVSMNADYTFDNPPEAIVQALDNHSHEHDMDFVLYDFPDIELEEEMSGSYENIEEFKEDFYDM